jgi:hypothetical protein
MQDNHGPGEPPMSMRRNQPITDRMIRAARLDPAVFEEVERDTGATGQAAIVVLIAGVATAIGALLGGGGIWAILAIISVFIGWIVWSFVTYWVGKTIFATTQTSVSPGEMLRTLGFAHTPFVLNVLLFIPVLGGIAGLVAWVWAIVAGVIAVRQAMDFDTGRAIGTVIVGAIIYIIIQAILAVVFGVGIGT